MTGFEYVCTSFSSEHRVLNGKWQKPAKGFSLSARYISSYTMFRSSIKSSNLLVLESISLLSQKWHPLHSPTLTGRSFRLSRKTKHCALKHPISAPLNVMPKKMVHSVTGPQHTISNLQGDTWVLALETRKMLRWRMQRNRLTRN